MHGENLTLIDARQQKCVTSIKILHWNYLRLTQLFGLTKCARSSSLNATTFTSEPTVKQYETEGSDF
jgi:hypothetical protein